MLKVHPIRQRDWLLLIIVLFAATLMRFSEPGVVEFFHDDAMVSTMAQELVSGERFPFTGIISSVGIPNPPQTIYTIALPFLISPHPAVAVAFVMGFNVIGVGLLWLIAHRYFGRIAALIAGLTYALSPWAVHFSRKIWAQEYHTPFILLAILLALYGFWEASRRSEDQPVRTSQFWAQVLTLPVLLWGLQIHFAAWFLLPIYAWLLWAGRQRIRWGALGLSLVLSALVMLPYIIGLAQTLEQDPTRITDAVGRSGASSGLSISGDALTSIAYLATGLGMETWVAPVQQTEMLAAVPPGPTWILIGLMSLAGMVLALIRREWHPFGVLLLVWIGLPMLALTPAWTPVYTHYFIPVIPALALAAGLSTATLANLVPLGGTGRAIILTAYCVLLVTQGIWFRGMLRYVDAVHVDYPGFTTPLYRLEAIAQTLDDYEDVVVLSYGMSWNLHHESVVWPVLLRDRVQCVRTLVGDGYAVFPDGPFAVLQAPDAPPDPVRNLYAQSEPILFPERPGSGEYRLYTFEEAPEWPGPAIQPTGPFSYDNGVQLTGYALADGIVYLEWLLPDGQRGVDYQFSAQIFDADGERLAQADRPFWQGQHWCPGDRLITWAPLDASAESAQLLVSLYQLGTGRDVGRYFSAEVQDASGTAIGRAAIIPLD